MYEGFRKWTATNLFIVPILNRDRGRLIENGFENAYIKDEIRNIDYENAVYLLFRPFNLEKFEKFLEEERNGRWIVDEYDYDDRRTMLVYQYDKDLQPDIDIIMKGKFSEVSPQYKNLIPRTLKSRSPGGVTKEVLTVQHEIFKKTKQLGEFWWTLYGLELDYKTDEFWEFYPEREIFTQETLKTIV